MAFSSKINQKCSALAYVHALPPPLPHFLWRTHSLNWTMAFCSKISVQYFAVSGVPNALHGDKIRNGPHVGTVATYPLPSRGSPMLCTGTKLEMAQMGARLLPNPYRLGIPQCSARGQNQKWPTCGHSGYLTPAVSGVPNALHGDKFRNGPHVGTVAT